MSETIVAPAANRERPIRFMDAFLAAITAIGANFFVGFIALFAVGVVWGALKLQGNPLTQLETNFYFVVGLTSVVALVALVFLFMVAKRFTAHPVRHFFAPVPVTTIFKAALSSLVLIAIGSAIELGLKYGLHLPMELSAAEKAMSPTTWTQFGIVVVFFVAFVPFYEEYLFRGFFFGWLKRVTPAWLAIVLTAALFALVHGLFATRTPVYGAIGTAEIFALGCLLAWWVHRTGSLWPAYAVHIVNNATAFTLAFFLPNL
jgi:membrane protease YdiL (CAAX protease family)